MGYFMDINNSVVHFIDSKSLNTPNQFPSDSQKWSLVSLHFKSMFLSMRSLIYLHVFYSDYLLVGVSHQRLGEWIWWCSSTVEQAKPGHAFLNTAALGTFLRLVMWINRSHFFKNRSNRLILLSLLLNITNSLGKLCDRHRRTYKIL